MTGHNRKLSFFFLPVMIKHFRSFAKIKLCDGDNEYFSITFLKLLDIQETNQIKLRHPAL